MWNLSIRQLPCAVALKAALNSFFAAINLPRMQRLLCHDGCLVESVLVPSACPFAAFVSSAVLLICETLCSLLKWCKPLNKCGIFGWVQTWRPLWSLSEVLGCGCSNPAFGGPVLQSGHCLHVELFTRKWLGKVNESCDVFLLHLSLTCINAINAEVFGES